MIKPWFPKLEFEYQSVYHFGDSEWESNLILICGLDKWYAQIVTGSWLSDGKSWINNYENLTNEFYSDKTNGEFVLYDSKNGRIKGLIVYKSLSRDDGQEIGYNSHSITDNYLGRFPHFLCRGPHPAMLNYCYGIVRFRVLLYFPECLQRKNPLEIELSHIYQP